ncbi:DNA-binding protein [Clostridium perfringens]|uniref:DNA-binding protein n=1 Tax=Clostridium perfringens TaxID=1502 RepID=UPI0010E3E9CF|nr:DNA-binding protein [Clostridium perfringens]ELC8371306.1 DNA-binding protein [Clostridium perfringens]MCX0358474.1 DNA-binding protein [Clostridium perfringens]MCX0386548.1 DNA-binding protein [Clostridium perfringens]MCX0407526.1 DNA-binding protein [Clostridium perfringens]MCX0419358.1 DNA-binding protein [Clostridium perfringens]
MKTAQEVANELDLTRTEVYNLLRKKRFSPLVKKNGGQVAISNELFKLLEEEIKSKRDIIKQQENKNIDIKQEDKLLEEKNTIADVKAEENTDFTSTIEILQNQIKLKDNQITILNNVITNNLKRIKDLEEKNHEFKELHEEVNNLRLVIDSIQTKKKRKRLLGVF